MEERVGCIAVPKLDAEKARKLLRSASLLVREYRPDRMGDLVLYPVSNLPKAIELLESNGIEAKECFKTFERVPGRPGRLSTKIKSYTLYGDIAVLGYTPSVAIDEYRRRLEDGK
jgi:tRNA G37 N-methylase Trm5